MTNAENLVLDGPVTIATVPRLVNRISSQLSAGVRSVDFSGIAEIDSAAVAYALEWQRQAEASHVKIELINFPEVLRNLANLYGVMDLLAPASNS